MNYPIDALIKSGAIPSVTFPSDSRYCGSKTLTYTAPDGETITFLARRFVPQSGPSNFSNIATHTVNQGDRLDLISARYYGDPLLFWIVCDSNNAMRPDELVDPPGRTLNITMPLGIPGGTNS